ncbi:hypothetical protein DXT77_05010 [Pseudomonas sp. 91RF]|jgi:hypothetical protein|uniref:hypothetical protein n=1 Tax=Pseudomonas sp. 91RF TaxID=2292261 RepID=UPI000E66ED07|nr:hypothetical protein [Pseudomonas sp. 91RF]RIJ12356.1 hypothetical protein DXT77_05010 [Pseudomonas sp. 91RF]
MRLKWICLGIFTFLLSAVIVPYIFVDGLSQRSPDVIDLSATRQYVLERVPFRLFPFDDNLAFLRVTDLNEPRKIYRSPLFEIKEIDMEQAFGSGRIGTPFLEFSVEKKSFVIHSTYLREHWLNRFVANAPYSVEPIVESGK